LAPVSIGLLLAGCFTIAKGAIFGVETAAIAVGVLLILLQYKINPALLVLGGAAVGVLSFLSNASTIIPVQNVEHHSR
jgi:chromate transporter